VTVTGQIKNKTKKEKSFLSLNIHFFQKREECNGYLTVPSATHSLIGSSWQAIYLMHVINTHLECLETDLQTVPTRHSHVSNSPLLKRSPPETPQDCMIYTATVCNIQDLCLSNTSCSLSTLCTSFSTSNVLLHLVNVPA